MSFPFYGKLWVATKSDLKNAILREKVLKYFKPTKDRNLAHRLIGNLLARYIVLCNNLSEIYDQTLQVQKRDVIEKLLVSSTNRLLELQTEMKKIEMSEFVYLDDALMELKMTPQNIEFLRPFYFPRKRDFEIQRAIDDIPKVSEINLEPPKGLNKLKKVLTPEEVEAEKRRQEKENAMNLIKAHELAKQARLTFLDIQMFPRKSKSKPRKTVEEIRYNFTYPPDQVPLHKIKRTNYRTDLHVKLKVNLANVEYYEPPTYRINNLGHKVMVPRKRAEPVVEEPEEDPEADEIEFKKRDEEIKLREEMEAETKRKRGAAAIIIQRSYRRYQLRKRLHIRNLKRMEICGLREVPEDPDRIKPKTIDEKNRMKRRERKKEFDESFMNALEDKKARIVKMKSQFIMEDITEDIRLWFREFYDGAKDFHRYPEEFEGGTIMVIRGESRTVEEFLEAKNKTPAQKAKEKELRKKKKKEEKRMKKKQALLDKKNELKRKKKERKEGPTWDFSERKSKTFDDLETSFNDYNHDWKLIDELYNRTESPIWDWVTIDAYSDVHKELRQTVDGFMRIELEILRAALAFENNTRYVPPIPKKQKKKRRKKKKPEDDDTEERSLEECCEELKASNIIRKYTRRSLDDFIGDQNFAALELRSMNKNTVECYGDIKNTLRPMVFGMGPLELPKVKSLCIAGPPNCGKKFLVEALCTEMDAVMIDLSPKNVAPIDDMVEFLNFIMEMAKKLQPTVIFIDGAHKPFIRSIPAAEVVEIPRKLGPFLFKNVVKKLKKEDAVMLMSTTNQPWNCNFGQMRKCFEKVVTFPPTLDYGTSLMTWKKGLREKRIYNFNASSLAQVTRNYTVGDILCFIDHHVDLRRRMKFPLKSLTSIELLEGLISGPNAKTPLDAKMIGLFKSFATKVDAFYYERKMTMARVQVEIDKEKEKEAKLEAIRNKKKK